MQKVVDDYSSFAFTFIYIYIYIYISMFNIRNNNLVVSLTQKNESSVKAEAWCVVCFTENPSGKYDLNYESE